MAVTLPECLNCNSCSLDWSGCLYCGLPLLSLSGPCRSLQGNGTARSADRRGCSPRTSRFTSCALPQLMVRLIRSCYLAVSGKLIRSTWAKLIREVLSNVQRLVVSFSNRSKGIPSSSSGKVSLALFHQRVSAFIEEHLCSLSFKVKGLKKSCICVFRPQRHLAGIFCKPKTILLRPSRRC